MRRIGLSPSTCGDFEDDGCVRITKASMRKSPRVDGSRGDRERSPMLNFSQFDVMTFDCYGTMIDWEAGITAAATAIAAGSYRLDLTGGSAWYTTSSWLCTGATPSGNVVAVTDGHARNFLLPRGLAIGASEGAIAQAAAMRKARDNKERASREAALAVASRLGAATVSVTAKAGNEGRLFGSVTSTEVAKAIAAQVQATEADLAKSNSVAARAMLKRLSAARTAFETRPAVATDEIRIPAIPGAH